MEQILLAQLSSLKQSSFKLILRSNAIKISFYCRQLSQFLSSNNILTDIVEQQDSMLGSDKIQLISETTYSNKSTTIQTIYTGNYTTSIFQYILNHCKLKCHHRAAYDIKLNYKIQPIIRFQYSRETKRPQMAKRSRYQQKQNVDTPVTQRNNARSNLKVISSRKNDEENSSHSDNDSYHGRKCYCCSKRSNDDVSQIHQSQNIFIRSPKNSILEDKVNKIHKKQSRNRHIRTVEKKGTNSPASIQDHSSQSERNNKNSNLYFQKYLQTLNGKKDSNDKANSQTNKKDNPVVGGSTLLPQPKTNFMVKRNRQLLSKCQINNSNQQKNDKIHSKLKNDASNKQIIKDNFYHVEEAFSKINQRKKQLKGRQTNHITYNPTIQIQHRFSQMIDTKNEKDMKETANNTNRSSKLHIKKMNKLNQYGDLSLKENIQSEKIRSNSKNTRISQHLLGRTKQKLIQVPSFGHKPILTKESSLVEKQVLRNNEHSSSHQLAANRIRKIPITQKNQSLKQEINKGKHIKKSKNKIGTSVKLKDDCIKNNTLNIHQLDTYIKNDLCQNIQRCRQPFIVEDGLEVKPAIQNNLEKDEDNFSITRQLFHKNEGYVEKQQQNDVQNCSFDRGEGEQQDKNDLAATIKQINYEDQSADKELNMVEDNNEEFPKAQRLHTSRTIPFGGDFLNRFQENSRQQCEQNVQPSDSTNIKRQEKDQVQLFQRLLQSEQDNQSSNHQPTVEQKCLKGGRSIFNSCNSESLIEAKKQNKNVPLLQPQEDRYNILYSSTNQIQMNELKQYCQNRLITEQKPLTSNKLVHKSEIQQSQKQININNQMPINGTYYLLKESQHNFDKNSELQNKQHLEKSILHQSEGQEQTINNQQQASIPLNKESNKGNQQTNKQSKLEILQQNIYQGSYPVKKQESAVQSQVKYRLLKDFDIEESTKGTFVIPCHDFTEDNGEINKRDDTQIYGQKIYDQDVLKLDDNQAKQKVFDQKITHSQPHFCINNQDNINEIVKSGERQTQFQIKPSTLINQSQQNQQSDLLQKNSVQPEKLSNQDTQVEQSKKQGGYFKQFCTEISQPTNDINRLGRQQHKNQALKASSQTAIQIKNTSLSQEKKIAIKSTLRPDMQTNEKLNGQKAISSKQLVIQSQKDSRTQVQNTPLRSSLENQQKKPQSKSSNQAGSKSIEPQQINECSKQRGRPIDEVVRKNMMNQRIGVIDERNRELQILQQSQVKQKANNIKFQNKQDSAVRKQFIYSQPAKQQQDKQVRVEQPNSKQITSEAIAKRQTQNVKQENQISQSLHSLEVEQIQGSKPFVSETRYSQIPIQQTKNQTALEGEKYSNNQIPKQPKQEVRSIKTKHIQCPKSSNKHQNIPFHNEKSQQQSKPLKAKEVTFHQQKMNSKSDQASYEGIQNFQKQQEREGQSSNTVLLPLQPLEKRFAKQFIQQQVNKHMPQKRRVKTSRSNKRYRCQQQQLQYKPSYIQLKEIEKNLKSNHVFQMHYPCRRQPFSQDIKHSQNQQLKAEIAVKSSHLNQIQTQKHQPNVKKDQNNIEIQTDYILPSDEIQHVNLRVKMQEDLNNYKHASHHSEKKKCKINLCQPEIVSESAAIENQIAIQDNHSISNLIHEDRYAFKIQQQFDEKLFLAQGSNFKTNDECKKLKSHYSNNLNQEIMLNQQFEAELEKFPIRKSQIKQGHLIQKKGSLIEVEINTVQQLNLQFKQGPTHPLIMNKLIYKDIPITQYQTRNNAFKEEVGAKLEIISNTLYFIRKYLPDFVNCLMNKQKTEICLFIDNQWRLFEGIPNKMTLQNLLIEHLKQLSVYKCLEMMTGMPLRTLKDKNQESNKRLIKSVKSLLERSNDQPQFETAVYGITKMNLEFVNLTKIRYFLDNSKAPRVILQCNKINAKKSEQKCNYEGQGINQFIQVFLLKHPKYLRLQVDSTAINTYQIELSRSIFYVLGTYKFILYEETSKNQYKLIKESHNWLKHKNQQKLTKYLLIVQPILQKEGQNIITMRLTGDQFEEEGNSTNRVVRYENGGKAKGVQGGYQNQKNLYLPVKEQIVKKNKKKEIL